MTYLTRADKAYLRDLERAEKRVERLGVAMEKATTDAARGTLRIRKGIAQAERNELERIARSRRLIVESPDMEVTP